MNETAVQKKTIPLKLKEGGKKFYKQRYYFLLLLPILVLFFLFKYLPMYGVIVAFKDYRFRMGILGSPWVGLKHFEVLFGSALFTRVLRNTLIISFLRIVFGFPAPILLALLINEVRAKRYKRVVQTVTYLPHFISWVVIAGIFIELLSLSRGVVNHIISLLGGEPIYFLASKRWFRSILVITGIWKTVGWGSVVYLAAISSIETEKFEAAIVDGATLFQRMRFITIPSIKHVMVIMLILRIGNVMDAGFDQVFNLYNDMVMPVADIIDTYVYRTGVLDMNYSFASAVGLFKNVIGFILVLAAGSRRYSRGEKVFFVFNYIVLGILALLCLYPFWDTLVLSFMTPEDATELGVRLWPKEFNFQAYKNILNDKLIGIGYLNTIFRTAMGTLLTVLLTYCAAYSLSKKNLMFRNTITTFIIITMFFNGGLIPTYLNIKHLGLMGSRWALILPMIANAWYLIITRSFISNLPDELEEAAVIDGAHPIRIVFSIMLPLSLPILAVISLWSAVAHWNDWFRAMLFVRERSKMVLQLILRRLLIDNAEALMERGIMSYSNTVPLVYDEMRKLMPPADWAIREKSLSMHRVIRGPGFAYTGINEADQQYGSDLGTIVTEFRINAITGKIDIDSEWDNYVERWWDFGGREVLEGYQEMYDRMYE